MPTRCHTVSGVTHALALDYDMPNARQIGLYAIENTVTGGFYLGASTCRITSRFSHHRWSLERGKHGNPRLQRSWNKHGADAFAWHVVALLDPADVYATETRLLARLVGHPKCYNVSTTHIGTCPGRRQSEESRRKRSDALKGRPLSEETRAKLSAAHRGKTLTAEHRAKIAAGGKGRAASIASRAATAERNRTRVWSDESRAKASASTAEALRQRWASMTPGEKAEKVAQLHATNAGKPRTAEWRAKLSAAKKGQPSPRKGQKLPEAQIAAMRVNGQRQSLTRARDDSGRFA